jgi:hypothetical protein
VRARHNEGYHRQSGKQTRYRLSLYSIAVDEGTITDMYS